MLKSNGAFRAVRFTEVVRISEGRFHCNLFELLPTFSILASHRLLQVFAKRIPHAWVGLV